MGKITKAIQNPSLITKALKNRLNHFHKLYIEKDEFTIAVDQWFKDRGDESLRLDYPLSQNSVVFDLGGYVGDFASQIHERYGCYVYVFEPVKEFYEVCVERFKGNEKIQCFNYGLSNEDGSLAISLQEDGSSLIRMGEDGRQEIVLLKSFDEQLLAKLKVMQIDLLKINIEGGEFLVIPHIISNGIIEKVKDLQIQFHNFYPDAKDQRDNIRVELARTHLEKWNYTFVWESWSLNASQAKANLLSTN
ncbi:hypothetical protein VL04_19525 [Chromobacterium violaceum]|uniref:FkbM family methyltransferase n=1 Tax=Chromobacterium violaceum TaxID=536 RepID=UPI000652BBCA|nr:FkbM family methyltransferase [Chromobacterium violaceum]KMN51722.1 hypothetical protein VK93_00645 [Chromobacterium violaceum]KMN84713.1 hypothetical protein VL02_18625 [Chromobacterium violaceum]KMN88670.1 hypothetical protein VL04_19525 [Chromobacterium violaceum]KMO05855.1 hypothetical protein VL16_00145 [Chromobacterium violaceum]